jgi:hypothetical protein
MEAVQDFSRFQEQRDYAAFRVLLALASFANEVGVVGAPGDFRSCPGHRAIAARAHVHRNTVGNVLPALLASGELAIVEQGGSKRGTWTVYRICLPMDGAGLAEEDDILKGELKLDEVLAQGSREAEDISLRELVEVMAQVLAQVSTDLAQMREVMAQGFGTFGTAGQRGIVPDPILDPTDPVDPGDPDGSGDGLTVGEVEDFPPLTAPSIGSGQATAKTVGEGDGEKGGQDGRAPRVDGTTRRRTFDRAQGRLAGAIAEVCGLDMRVESHRARCEEAAMQLDGYGEGYILARYGTPEPGTEVWNWYRHDWRGRKGEQPEPRWVVETIRKVWQGTGNRDAGAGNGERANEAGAMSNNAATARRYAELRRKFMEE